MVSTAEMQANAEKAEFIVWGDRRQLARIDHSPSITFVGQQLWMCICYEKLPLFEF